MTTEAAPAAPSATAPTDAPAIRTEGLTKRYGSTVAVDNLSLSVQRGEVFGLLGPNGAGKTTTILMLLGLTEPSAGKAEVVGLDPTRDPLGVKRRVGYLPDNVGFYGTLTGRQNLRYTARLNGLTGDEAEQRVAGLLEQVGLADAADARVDTYSRGMRQRLGIADALVKDPEVVILDEPTIAIDPEGVAEVLALIRSLARDRGSAVLLSSHLLYQVESVCDRVGIFVTGRLVAQGPMATLAEQLATGPVRLEIAVDGDPGQVEAALRRVPSVLEVHREGQGWTVLASEDVRPVLVRALVHDGFNVLRLHRADQALDELYRRFFAQEQA